MRKNFSVRAQEKKINPKKILVFGIFFLTAVFFFVFHKSILPIEKLEINGLFLINKEEIAKMVQINESLLSIDKEDLTSKIFSLGFVDEVNISVKLLNKLVIQIKEKEIVARIIYQDKKYYLTSKGLLLSEKSYIHKYNFPEINLKKKIDSQRLILLSYHLALMKFYDKNFFFKISEISFEGIENSDIFIICNFKKYIFNWNLQFEDFLKMRYLDSLNLSYRVYDLRGKYILTKES